MDNNRIFYAHTKKNCTDQTTWQPLFESHLLETAQIASGRTAKGHRSNDHDFAAGFDSSYWLTAAGMLHDLGKTDLEFQKYLFLSSSTTDTEHKLFCSVNHSEAGAAWAEENLDSFCGRTLAYIIAGHHSGLPDCYGKKSSLSYRLESGKKNLKKIQNQINSFVQTIDPGKLLPPASFQLSPNNYHLWVRMMFSCLVDADRLNTEAFDDPEKAAKRPVFPSLAELKEKFDQFMSTFTKRNKENENEMESVLNQARQKVHQACVNAGKSVTKGICSLTVPTGGGKTLSSMAFALEHAVKNNKSRIIYVIPYTSIIEQTAEIFRKIFGDNNVIEHHCNFNSVKWDQDHQSFEEEENNSISSEQMELAAENWDAPIIITTNVQFFESLYASKTKSCRKLHRIVNSVVILDEAQMLKPELLSPCVDVINQLSESFGVTFVVCTATQPTLDRLNQIKPNYSNLKEVIPIIPKDLENHLYHILSRVNYTFDEPKTRRNWNDLASELVKQNEVLCVVNSRKDCYDLYQSLRAITSLNNEENSETIHLSALMCGEHRSQLIEKIKNHLEANRQAEKAGKRISPIRVISTQLVEAGVNLDFPVLYRAMAGLDSIIQAAGRCNREGKLGIGGGKVIVFNPPKDPAAAVSGILYKGTTVTREILLADQTLNPQKSETVSRFFEHFYYSLNSLDEKEIIKRLTQNVNNVEGKPEVPFRSVAEDFRLIDDKYSTPVIVAYQNGDTLIHCLEVEGPHRDLMRNFQRYTVNVPLLGKNGLMEMITDGKIRELYPGIYVQQMPGLYDDTVGLNIFSPTIPNDALIL